MQDKKVHFSNLTGRLVVHAVMKAWWAQGRPHSLLAKAEALFADIASPVYLFTQVRQPKTEGCVSLSTFKALESHS